MMMYGKSYKGKVITQTTLLKFYELNIAFMLYSTGRGNQTIHKEKHKFLGKQIVNYANELAMTRPRK